MTTPLLTEGDPDRDRRPDVGSEHFRCGIGDPATGAVCTKRLHDSDVDHHGYEAVHGGGRDRRVVTWRGGKRASDGY
jgi:hypothetical protein